MAVACSGGPIPPLLLLVYLLAQPLLLSAIVFACAFAAAYVARPRAGLRCAVLGLALPLAAVAGEYLRISAAVMGTWYPDGVLNAGPVIGAVLAVITLHPFFDARPVLAEQ